MLGLRDYVDKNRFPGVVLGLSGGIDSAICTAMAVDALGPDRVHCVMMPFRYTSQESLVDAKACADALGVRYDIVRLPIRWKDLKKFWRRSLLAAPATSPRKICKAVRAARC